MHWKKASEDEFNHEVIPDGKSNSYTLKDLDLGTSYQVKIRAFNKRYGSTFSDLKSFPTMIEQKGIDRMASLSFTSIFSLHLNNDRKGGHWS